MSLNDDQKSMENFPLVNQDGSPASSVGPVSTGTRAKKKRSPFLVPVIWCVVENASLFFWCCSTILEKYRDEHDREVSLEFFIVALGLVGLFGVAYLVVLIAMGVVEHRVRFQGRRAPRKGAHVLLGCFASGFCILAVACIVMDLMKLVDLLVEEPEPGTSVLGEFVVTGCVTLGDLILLHISISKVYTAVKNLMRDGASPLSYFASKHAHIGSKGLMHNVSGRKRAAFVAHFLAEVCELVSLGVFLLQGVYFTGVFALTITWLVLLALGFLMYVNAFVWEIVPGKTVAAYLKAPPGPNRKTMGMCGRRHSCIGLPFFSLVATAVSVLSIVSGIVLVSIMPVSPASLEQGFLLIPGFVLAFRAHARMFHSCMVAPPTQSVFVHHIVAVQEVTSH